MAAKLLFIMIGAMSAGWFFFFDRIFQYWIDPARSLTRLAIRIIAYLPAYPMYYFLSAITVSFGVVSAAFLAAFITYEMLRRLVPID